MSLILASLSPWSNFCWSDAFFSQQGDRFAKPGHGREQIFNHWNPWCNLLAEQHLTLTGSYGAIWRVDPKSQSLLIFGVLASTIHAWENQRINLQPHRFFSSFNYSSSGTLTKSEEFGTRKQQHLPTQEIGYSTPPRKARTIPIRSVFMSLLHMLEVRWSYLANKVA